LFFIIKKIFLFKIVKNYFFFFKSPRELVDFIKEKKKEVKVVEEDIKFLKGFNITLRDISLSHKGVI
jgi:hypothetical protein